MKLWTNKKCLKSSLLVTLMILSSFISAVLPVYTVNAATCPVDPNPGKLRRPGNVVVTVNLPSKTTHDNLTLDLIKYEGTSSFGTTSHVTTVGTATTCPPTGYTSNQVKATFFDVEGGKFKVCFQSTCSADFTRPNPGNNPDNDSISLTVTNTGGSLTKSVNVIVKIDIPDATEAVQYGPVKITLFDQNGKPTGNPVETEKIDIGTGKKATTISLPTAVLADVAPGLFKVCTGDANDICSAPFEKLPLEVPTITINVPVAKSSSLLGGLSAGTKTGSSCVISGIGWIVCPVVNFLASIADGSFKFLSDNFLRTNINVFDTSGPTYKAWAIMRDFANLAFVAAFLVIIFSQLTSVGITNYGLKKLLPKIIIAAILVNLSYFFCQIAVDLSNIVGYSLKDLLSTIGAAATSGSTSTDWGSTDGGFLGIAGGVLSTAVIGTAVWMNLAALIPVLISAVFALLLILFILVGRQVLILLLIVISPIAFVAYLLPNTGKWFTTWRKTFVAMLVVFPVIALIFGASKLASTVLSAAYNAPGTDSWFGQIAAAAVLVLPLFAVPIVIKKSLDGVGAVGSTLNGWGSKLGTGAAGKWSGSRLNKHWEGEQQKKEALIQSGAYENDYKGRNPFRRLTGSVNSLRSGGYKKFNESGVSGKFGDRSAASGLALASKMEEEEVNAAGIQLGGYGLTGDQLQDLAINGSTTNNKGVRVDANRNNAMRAAAIKQMVATGDANGIKKAWDASKTWQGAEGDHLRGTMADSLQASSSRPIWAGQGEIAKMRIGEGKHATADEAITNSINSGAYSASKLAAADKDELAQVAKVIADPSSPGLSREQKAAFVSSVNTALTDDNLAPTLAKNRQQLDEFTKIPF